MSRDDQSEQIKELWEYIIKTENDPKYQKEGKPAFLFSLHATKLLGIEFDEIIENENDPPDFFISKGKETSNLEITSLAEDFYWQKNAFFKEIEMIAQEIIQKHEHLLPTGLFMFYYIPTSKVAPPKPKFWISLPAFKNKIKRAQLKKVLIENIPQWFKDYKDDNTKNSCIIINKKGLKIGEFNLSKFGESDLTKWMLMPQRVFRTEEWTNDNLQKELQKRINEKNHQYSQNPEIKTKYPGEWWLLISDIQNFLNTHYFNFEVKDIKVKSDFFERIFFIPGVLGRPNIYELNILDS